MLSIAPSLSDELGAALQPCGRPRRRFLATHSISSSHCRTASIFLEVRHSAISFFLLDSTVRAFCLPARRSLLNRPRSKQKAPPSLKRRWRSALFPTLPRRSLRRADTLSLLSRGFAAGTVLFGLREISLLFDYGGSVDTRVSSFPSIWKLSQNLEWIPSVTLTDPGVSSQALCPSQSTGMPS